MRGELCGLSDGISEGPEPAAGVPDSDKIKYKWQKGRMREGASPGSALYI